MSCAVLPRKTDHVSYTRFSYAGCFAMITCAISPISHTVCNQIPACSNPAAWIALENVPYYEQQYPLFMLAMG